MTENGSQSNPPVSTREKFAPELPTSTTVPPDQQGLPQALPGATPALILLLVINLFNFMDRQVLAAVEPEISKEILTVNGKPIPLQEFWSGLLAFAFLATYMFSAPLFGFLANSIRRWTLVGFGVIFWSIAILASGLDWVLLLGVGIGIAYWILLVTRCLVGVGEGAYGPVAPTMIADLYPVRMRGMVMSLFYLAIPVGSALGYALGGLVIKSGLSWRWAFYLVVPPGVLLGLICFFMREPPRGKTDGIQEADTSEKQHFKVTRQDYYDLFRIPSYTLNLLGMTCLMFAIGAIAYWMPRYFVIKNVGDIAGIDPRTFFGILLALAGLTATILGGVAGDMLRNKFSGSYFLVSTIAMILGFPMVLLAIWTPFPFAWFFIFLGIFCLFFNTAPTNAINVNVTHPAVRGTAFGINILLTHLLGDALSPSLVGLVSRLTADGVEPNLNVGFMLVSIMMLLGGLFWIWGSFYLKKDTDEAPTRIREFTQKETQE